MYSIMQLILSMFPHNIKYVLNQERDIIIHVILKKKKKKKKTQNKIFLSFKIFQCFWNFFIYNQNNLRK